MSIESHHRAPSADHRAAGALTADTVAQADAEERADVEEDRRRQRELDDAELGGEA